MLKILLVLLLGACNAPLVKPGAYAVQIEYTKDTWPVGNLEGETSEAVWVIAEHDGVYQLGIQDTAHSYSGMEVDDHVVFVNEQYAECFESHLLIEVFGDDRNIYGTGSIEVVVGCHGDGYITEVVFTGKEK